MNDPIADARADLLEAIASLVNDARSEEEPSYELSRTWRAVEKAIDFFENTVDAVGWAAALATLRDNIAKEEAGL
jgi:hypothetical protein